jgi:hypothetical protein
MRQAEGFFDEIEKDFGLKRFRQTINTACQVQRLDPIRLQPVGQKEDRRLLGFGRISKFRGSAGGSEHIFGEGIED